MEIGYSIIPFDQRHIDIVLDYEKELRRQEPDTYYWEPDDQYRAALVQSFADAHFANAVSYLALAEGKVVGRIDACLIASRSDATCCSAYLDWLCVLPGERHNGVAQMLLDALRKDLRARHVALLVALIAQNEEAQRFYRAVEGASIHDEGIWIDV